MQEFDPFFCHMICSITLSHLEKEEKLGQKNRASRQEAWVKKSTYQLPAVSAAASALGKKIFQ